MKVYIFYYKKELYAHTTDKRIRDEFIKYRNMGVFSYVKKKLTNSEYSEFKKVYRMQTLDDFVYGSNGDSGYTQIVATYYEDDKVSTVCSEYDEEIRRLCDELMCIDDLKCRDSVFYLMNIFEMKYIGNEKYPVSMINSLSVFVNLFKDTLL